MINPWENAPGVLSAEPLSVSEIKQLVDQLEAGVAPVIRPWTLARLLMTIKARDDTWWKS